MTVLAVGDSVSFGLELSDLDLVPENARHITPSQLAYPNLLADKLGTDCKNLSLIGGSNDRTFRVTVDQILQRRYDLVICNWTSIGRFDFTYHKQDIALTVATSPWQIEEFPWFKSFIADHYDPDQMIQRFFANVVALQALLEQLEQPYIFANGCSVPTILNQHQAGHVNQAKYVAWGTSFYHWCKEQELAFGPQGHFLEAGHELVADRLYTIVKELYR
jgi:lysophospholipase L1-like esterase